MGKRDFPSKKQQVIHFSCWYMLVLSVMRCLLIFKLTLRVNTHRFSKASWNVVSMQSRHGTGRLICLSHLEPKLFSKLHDSHPNPGVHGSSMGTMSITPPVFPEASHSVEGVDVKYGTCFSFLQLESRSCPASAPPTRLPEKDCRNSLSKISIS